MNILACVPLYVAASQEALEDMGLFNIRDVHLYLSYGQPEMLALSVPSPASLTVINTAQGGTFADAMPGEGQMEGERQTDLQRKLTWKVIGLQG